MTLIPLKVKLKLQAPFTATQAVSRPNMGTLEDGLDYLLKTDRDQWPGMAAEYICCHLAEGVGVPVPKFCVAQDLDGSLIFASQIFGTPSQNAANRAAQSRFLASSQPNPEMVRQISKLYAFDLITHNTDRHINNLLFREQNRSMRVLAIDFDRSLFFNWPLPGLPLSANCQTMITGRDIRRVWGFDLGAAIELTMSMARVPKGTLEYALTSMPQGWLANDTKNELLTWWGGGARIQRLRHIVKGLKDGTLL